MSLTMRGNFVCRSCRKHLLLKSPRRKFSATVYQRADDLRPSIAPKPVIDIKHIRQNPGLYEYNCKQRNYERQASNSWRILELFEQWQDLQKNSRSLREENNRLQRELGSSMGDGLDGKRSEGPVDREAVLVQAKELKQRLSQIEEQEAQYSSEMQDLALQLPNLSSKETPEGAEFTVIGHINDHPEPKPASSDRVWRSHVHIGSELDILDFAAAANTSGWGWYFLTNEAALLEQALIQYAFSVARKRGWRVVAPPSVVYSHIATACGFRPRDQNDEQQIYKIEQPEKDQSKPELCLAGTAEIPLAGMKANSVLEEEDLPLKVVGVSRSYRAEAGARGVDTKGLYRVHEFTKVEMFAWTKPDEEGVSYSQDIFDEMVSIQKEILASLGLHCRILEMPTTDLGASASRKQDIEAFFPSRRERDDGWGEVTSTSICTDYQSRRLATRMRTSNKKGRKLDWPHTVNGTAIAVPRVLAAILENGWDESQNEVKIPPVLRPWMDGLDVIKRKI